MFLKLFLAFTIIPVVEIYLCAMQVWVLYSVFHCSSSISLVSFSLLVGAGRFELPSQELPGSTQMLGIPALPLPPCCLCKFNYINLGNAFAALLLTQIHMDKSNIRRTVHRFFLI